MKRISFLGVALATLVGACSPSQQDASRPVLARQRQPLEVPANTLVATETGPDGRAAGHFGGQSAVSSDGAATYRLPLWVPTGRAGLAPELELQYTSDGGNGLLGMGWNVSGMSRISRCERTVAQDGAAEPIAFSHEDAYCLDGERLIQLSWPPPGGSSREFRTESESYSRIVSIDGDASGPGYFRVYLKNGNVLTYGGLNGATFAGPRIRVRPLGDSDSQTLSDGQQNRYQWALARVEDRSGNYLSIHYTQSTDPVDGGQEHLPSRIEYTGSTLGGGRAPTRSVEFFFEERPDARSYFVSGFKVKLGKRLKSLSMFGPSPSARGLLRSYAFSYVTNPVSQASLLSQVEECDVTACKRPVTFSWTPGDAGYDVTDTGFTDLTRGALPSTEESPLWLLQPADLNGDGRDDLLYRTTPATGQYRWLARFSSATGYSSAHETELPRVCATSLDALGDGRWGDINLDGLTDVILSNRTDCSDSTSAVLKTYLRDAARFTWVDDGTRGRLWLSDLQGDGLPEAIQEVARKLRYRPNVGGQLQPFQPLYSSAGGYDTLDYAVNVDGTPRTHLLIRPMVKLSSPPETYEPVGKRYWRVWWRNNAFSMQETTLVHADVANKVYLFADINGDGLPDALRTPKEGGDLEVQMNTGDGFTPPVAQNLPAHARLGSWSQDNGVRVGDFNNDGRQDLLLMGGLGTTRTHLMLLESQGTSFAVRDLATPVVAASATRGYTLSQVLDVNGDGLLDYAHVYAGTLRIHTRRGGMPGLLTGVTDSLGAQVAFQYKPISDPSVHTRATSCTLPTVCVNRGRWVVSQHSVDAGNGHPMRTALYQYQGGKQDVLGRGWLGFEQVKATEVQTGVVRTRFFNNSQRQGTYYPLARKPFIERFQATRDDGNVYREVRTEHEVLTRPGADGRSYFIVLPKSAVETQWEYRESEGPQSRFQHITQLAWTYDPDYGNLTSKTRTFQDGEKRVWSATYQNAPLDWLVGLPLTVEETSTAAGRSVTRRMSFEYYAGTRLLKKETVEPGDLQLELVTTHVRDADGLTTQVRREGRGHPARTQSFTYDTVDRTWPASMTNEAGHVFQFAYHGGLGVLAASTDENGILTRWRYDWLGRLRSEDGPTEADTTVSYLPGATAPLLVTTQEAGGQESQQVYDRLGRVVSTRSRGFDGSYVFHTVGFDGLGRVTELTRPDPRGGPANVRLTRAYDLVDRLRSETHADGTVRSFEYLGRTDGIHVLQTDEKGQVRQVLIDAQGRPVRSQEPRPSGGLLTTSFAYGPFGVLDQATDPAGNTVLLEYDRLGRRTRIQDPDTGTVITRYNPFGEVMEVIDGNGDSTTYTRDTLGRQLTLTSTRDGVSRFVWDTAPQGLGRLASSTQEGDPATALDDLSVAHAYDALGRPSVEAWNVEGQPYVLEQTYDGYGRLEHVRYPVVGGQRLSVRYGYTAWGAMTSVSDSASGQVFWQAAARNGLGQLTSELYGNGVVTQRLHDVVGRLRFIDTRAGAAPVQALAFEHEANGNLRSRHDRIARTTEDFGYDSLDRLTRWTVSQNCRKSVLEYGYDDLGNLRGWTVAQGTGTSQALTYGGPGAGPHAVTGSAQGAYTYDAAGNQVTAPGRQVEYTGFNLPRRISDAAQSVTYRYNAHGVRTVKRSTRGTATFYVGGLYEQRRAPGGEASHVFHIRGAERSVAQAVWETSSSGQLLQQRTLYLHADALGSVETLTDDAGQVVARMKYGPFGARAHPVDLTQPQGQVSWDVYQGYTGHEHDEEFGLINMKGRIYDARLGRFLSPDPMVQAPLSGQSFNRYSYVFNNPLRYTDPSGFIANDITYYDSWYGGYVTLWTGGSTPGWGRFSDPYIDEGWEEDIEVVAPDEMSPEFHYFLLRMQSVIGGGIMGGIAGVVPGGHAFPVPEGESREFYRAYGSAMTVVSIVEMGVGLSQIVTGLGELFGGGAASATGAGAVVGVPLAATGLVSIMAGAVLGVEGMADYDKGQQILQMSNQAPGSGGPPPKGPPPAPPPPARPPARTEPAGMAEKLVMEQAKEGRGNVIMQGPFGDPKYSDPGWVKMGHTYRTPRGEIIDVHYMKNTRTGATDQFKFKNDPPVTDPP